MSNFISPSFTATGARLSRYLTLCSCGLLLLISACDGWPPLESDARNHFEEHRESFERLARKMRSTDYWRVAIEGAVVEVTPTDDGDYEEQFKIEDDPEWRELLDDVRMFMVLQSDGAVWTDPGGMWGNHENRIGHNGFAHNPSMLDEYKLCQSGHENIPCGLCAVDLGDDWYIYYRWFPEHFSKDDLDAYLDGRISLDEYSDLKDEGYRQCHIDGYAKMGYDVGKLFNIEKERVPKALGE